LKNYSQELLKVKDSDLDSKALVLNTFGVLMGGISAVGGIA
jgi:hypothetical protein